MDRIEIPPIRRRERVADTMMIPIMFVLRGFRTDSLQESHRWHPQSIEQDEIDPKLAVENHGNDSSRFSFEHRGSFLFHAPIFGGWKDFGVYEVDKSNSPFYVGWIVFRSSDNKFLNAAIHRLPIFDNQIRLLDGNKDSWGYFFALDKDGVQVPLKKVGAGRIGDKSFTQVRIF